MAVGAGAGEAALQLHISKVLKGFDNFNN
jgi:hypothetical protein